MLRGLELIDGYRHTLAITNTVVTARSYTLLPGAVAALAHLERLAQMEFWVYWPMSERDEKGLIARHTDVLPYLKQAIAQARALGRRVEVKNFPQCLLGDDAGALVNGQPQLFIDPAFWSEFMRNGFDQCIHRDRCAATECLGLNTAYIARFGYEAEALQPFAESPAQAAAIAGREER
jgi:hypothetical protein